MEGHHELSTTQLFQLLELSPARKKLKKMAAHFFSPAPQPTPTPQPNPTPPTPRPSDPHRERLHCTDPGTLPAGETERKLSSRMGTCSKSSSSVVYRALPVGAYEESLVQRDKEKDPLKYKIINEALGVEEKRVRKLKQQEVDRIKEEYLRNKGLQYLRDPTLNKQPRSKTQPSREPPAPTPTPALGRDYVRQIFADLAEARKAQAEKKL